MRYVAKFHTLDVMDQIVVSGYVRDCEALDVPVADPYEFTWQWPGRGESDARVWLLQALLQAADRVRSEIARGPGRPPSEGVKHTIPGVDDTAQNTMGLTAVGGPGRAKGSARRSRSGHLRG